MNISGNQFVGYRRPSGSGLCGDRAAAMMGRVVARTLERKVKLPPTSDRIPGLAPAQSVIHDHKWKRGATESEATIKEIRRKAGRIAPAYNKGALQYLPDDKN